MTKQNQPAAGARVWAMCPPKRSVSLPATEPASHARADALVAFDRQKNRNPVNAEPSAPGAPAVPAAWPERWAAWGLSKANPPLFMT
jgi:hypothetical protein